MKSFILTTGFFVGEKAFHALLPAVGLNLVGNEGDDHSTAERAARLLTDSCLRVSAEEDVYMCVNCTNLTQRAKILHIPSLGNTEKADEYNHVTPVVQVAEQLLRSSSFLIDVEATVHAAPGSLHPSDKLHLKLLTIHPLPLSAAKLVRVIVNSSL